MTEPKPKSVLVSMRASELRGRGAVYRWLNNHYRAVVKGFEKTESTWEGVIDALVSAGVTNRTGGRPTANAVLRVWQRVCEDRAARQRKARRKQPVRARPPGSYEPPVAATRAPTGARGSAAPAMPASNPSLSAGVARQGEREDLPDHAKEAFAALKRQFAFADRHIIRSADED